MSVFEKSFRGICKFWEFDVKIVFKSHDWNTTHWSKILLVIFDQMGH